MFLHFKYFNVANMSKLALILFVLLFSTGLESASLDNKVPKVCIIGAGISGLLTSRYLKEEGIPYVVYEANSDIGGVWRYEDRIGADEYGRPIHTSLYKNLRTNAPKPVMEFPDLPLPDEAASYPSAEVYYDYIKAYAKHFDLDRHVKLLHHVTLVTRRQNDWKVNVKDMLTGKVSEQYFDFVVIAAGRYNRPNWPIIKGADKFKGKIIHSHDYREPEPYRCKRVLVIGAGPSALDIALQVASVGRTLVHSHHAPFQPDTSLRNYVCKPDVKELNETGAIFADGTFEEIDEIIYCTGYDAFYPFLDETSGISTNKKDVRPLHHGIVNINHPSMTIIRSEAALSLTAEARYVTALIKGNFTLPSREDMMRGIPPVHNIRAAFFMSELFALEDIHYRKLAEESGIYRVKPVFTKIIVADVESLTKEIGTFRNYNYTVIDEENFTRTYVEPKSTPLVVGCSA